ncbi:hypothetical protein GW758_03375 [Candidatus Falkowbacteria bacterium]|nr:hypothetical protein [Candidatus Falkowbacteria bacterium]NCT54968.1 hypothetical protein [Candidatus Falkowbacteria bacterium]
MKTKKLKNLERVGGLFLGNKAFLIALVVLMTLSLSACSITTSTDGLQTGASIFYSSDKGNVWRDSSLISSPSATLEKITNLDIKGFYGDPSDNLAVYAATAEGLYYTYNVSKGWNKVGALPNELVRSVAVSPANKCLIYVAIANRLHKSDDCARTFTQAYYDNDKTVSVTSVIIDSYNPRNLYLGTSRGEIIKSIDSGTSWRTIYRLDEPVARVVSDPQDSRLIFVATEKSKLYSFVSNTETNPLTSEDIDRNFQVNNFRDLNSVLTDLKVGTKFKDLVSAQSDGALFLATSEMILRSTDEGTSWESLNLIQPDGKAEVNVLAINPKDSKEIYYVTNGTFFRSSDGAVTWTTKKLPSARGGSALLVDFSNPNSVYLGTSKVVTK